jgi:hypothetical protein
VLVVRLDVHRLVDKYSLHPGHDYAYRANTRAWEKAEDPPVRATLVESLPGGRHRLRLETGEEIEGRSSQLVARWDEREIDDLLRSEERSRTFSAETVRDDHLAEAVTLVLSTISTEAYAHSDRAWMPTADEARIRDAAAAQDALIDLSPVAYRDEDEAICLPLPVAGQLARRIAERNPEAVEAAVQASLTDAMSRGHLAIVPKYYKPGWDMALAWAGRAPVTLPEPEARPADAYERLREQLRGRGVRKSADEDHAWTLPEQMLMELGHLLGGATRYSGRLTLRPLSDGHVRLALDSGRRWRTRTPDEIHGSPRR